ncbi:hypothetical protein BT96DRAFT_948160 [Gymnopus androsaceus JB14]|uniref:Uncharacterized protein n=1 Tax=Gymnopus androsaceus JB14 TaxID=1447944 RepID=A0A6A4GQI9_9AGAR|nr:hypothetical protein BT96DRAFT_948160 [Gymnopus androsaceus JB14]
MSLGQHSVTALVQPEHDVMAPAQGPAQIFQSPEPGAWAGLNGRKLPIIYYIAVYQFLHVKSGTFHIQNFGVFFPPKQSQLPSAKLSDPTNGAIQLPSQRDAVARAKAERQQKEAIEKARKQQEASEGLEEDNGNSAQSPRDAAASSATTSNKRKTASPTDDEDVFNQSPAQIKRPRIVTEDPETITLISNNDSEVAAKPAKAKGGDAAHFFENRHRIFWTAETSDANAKCARI